MKSYSMSGKKAKSSADLEYKIPPDMIVVMDTREQDPLFTSRIPKGLIITRDTLKNGDYSIRGFEDKIMFERKRMSDLGTYIGRDHQMTKEKLSRCKDYDFVSLIIEEEERDILFAEKQFSQVSNELFRQAIASLEIRFRMHVYYSRSRKDVERWMLDRMIKYYNVKRETI